MFKNQIFSDDQKAWIWGLENQLLAGRASARFSEQLLCHRILHKTLATNFASRKQKYPVLRYKPSSAGLVLSPLLQLTKDPYHTTQIIFLAQAVRTPTDRIA
jgi:hypothetical protein